MTVYSLRATSIVAAIATTLSLAAAQAAQAASFTPLGDLPGDAFFSVANGISADGLVVVGQSRGQNGEEAFRWTQSGGMVGLGHLAGISLPPYGVFYTSEATAVSADGSVVIGQSSTANGNGNTQDEYEAFRWTQSGGMVGLGDLPGGRFTSRANAVSADGSVVVGIGVNAMTVQALRWTQSSGMMSSTVIGNDIAIGVSADGVVVAGSDGLMQGNGNTIRLGDLPGGANYTEAKGMSANGLVVVGDSNSSLGREAFRWTQSGGMVGLGDLPGGSFRSQALATSGDGSVVVGYGTGTKGDEAFVWNQTQGMSSLQSVLAAAGINMTGWQLSSANGVSANGRSIVGSGINPNGQSEAWLAQLDAPRPVAVPTPSLLPGLISIGLGVWRRRKAVQDQSAIVD
jgi:probable HAF family extracellular repeat protein